MMKKDGLHTWLLVAQVVLLLVVTSQLQALRGDLGGTNPLAENAVADPQPSQPKAPSPTVVQVSADDDPVKGDANAPVTIVEFSDYQCPFCGRFFSETLPQIQKEYIDTGKVKFVYRDFPLSFHPEAEPAAIAANCAGEQGKYFEFHDKIFQNQATMSSSSYNQWAADIGLDLNTFKQCMDNPEKQRQEIQKDLADGQSYGVTGTPGFFVNGVKISGAQPYSVFKQIIEAELSK